MLNQCVTVVGASAGGIEPLRLLVSKLPPDFPGPIFIVVHIGSHRSILPKILSSAGPLPAIHPTNGQLIGERTIYVAPPDCHMLLSEPGRIELSHGPKVNHTRPAINPLFRSAAVTYGSSVTGVILSGNLDDGVLGLAEIKLRGGRAIVQDPKTAVYPSMPSCAAELVPVDFIVPVEEMAALLHLPFRSNGNAEMELAMNKIHSDLTCPECRGPLTEFRSGVLSEYRCRVGHAYSSLALAQDHQTTVERKLWESVLVLEESAEISERLAVQFGGNYQRQAKSRREQAAIVRDLLNDISQQYITD